MKTTAVQRALLIGALAAAGLSRGSAQKPPGELTREPNLRGTVTFLFNNGRFWNGMKPDLRLAFIIGYMDSFHAVADDNANQWVPQGNGIAVADVAKGLDKFFAEPENLRFSVVDAIRIFAMKVAGKPQSEIEARMKEMRAWIDLNWAASVDSKDDN